MKELNLSTSTATLAEHLDLAGKENLIIKTRDGREFVVAEVDDFDNEVALVRQNAELMKLLAERSGEPGRYSLAAVKDQRGM